MLRCHVVCHVIHIYTSLNPGWICGCRNRGLACRLWEEAARCPASWWRGCALHGGQRSFQQVQSMEVRGEQVGGVRAAERGPWEPRLTQSVS